MPVVYKYALKARRHTIPMPDGAVVHVGIDGRGDHCIWVQHADPDGIHRERVIFTVGTGQDVPQPANHLGSFADLPYIWHIYSPNLERHP